MNDEELRALYSGVSAKRPASRLECPSAETLLGVVEGTLPERDRLGALRHVGACADCRADLELLRAAAAAGQRAVRPAWVRAPALALAATLALVAAGLVWLRSPEPIADGFRGLDSGITQLAPPADRAVSRPVTLTWGAVSGATRYEVELLDEAGRVVFSARTGDTAVSVADSVALDAGVAYRWWVRTDLLNGGQRRSTLRRLSIQTP